MPFVNSNLNENLTNYSHRQHSMYGQFRMRKRIHRGVLVLFYEKGSTKKRISFCAFFYRTPAPSVTQKLYAMRTWVSKALDPDLTRFKRTPCSAVPSSMKGTLEKTRDPIRIDIESNRFLDVSRGCDDVITYTLRIHLTDRTENTNAKLTC